MPRDEERINFTLPRETKDELLAIVESHRRNLSQELKLLIECFIAIQKNKGVINPDLTVSTGDDLMSDENRVREIVRAEMSQEFDARGIRAGVVHGLSVADSASGFEKAKSYARGKY